MSGVFVTLPVYVTEHGMVLLFPDGDFGLVAAECVQVMTGEQVVDGLVAFLGEAAAEEAQAFLDAQAGTDG